MAVLLKHVMEMKTLLTIMFPPLLLLLLSAALIAPLGGIIKSLMWLAAK